MLIKRKHKGVYQITKGNLVWNVSKQWISGEWIAELNDYNHPRYNELEFTDDKLKYIKERIEGVEI